MATGNFAAKISNVLHFIFKLVLNNLDANFKCNEEHLSTIVECFLLLQAFHLGTKFACGQCSLNVIILFFIGFNVNTINFKHFFT